MWESIKKLEYRTKAGISDAKTELNNRLSDRMELPLWRVPAGYRQWCGCGKPSGYRDNHLLGDAAGNGGGDHLYPGTLCGVSEIARIYQIRYFQTAPTRLHEKRKVSFSAIQSKLRKPKGPPEFFLSHIFFAPRRVTAKK